MVSTNIRALPGIGFVDSDKNLSKIPQKTVLFYHLITIRPKIELLNLEMDH